MDIKTRSELLTEAYKQIKHTRIEFNDIAKKILSDMGIDHGEYGADETATTMALLKKEEEIERIKQEHEYKIKLFKDYIKEILKNENVELRDLNNKDLTGLLKLTDQIAEVGYRIFEVRFPVEVGGMYELELSVPTIMPNSTTTILKGFSFDNFNDFKAFIEKELIGYIGEIRKCLFRVYSEVCAMKNTLKVYTNLMDI